MKNKCKHREVILTDQVYCSFSDLLSIIWCCLCGSTKYNWRDPEYNKKYGKWKSPKSITVRPGPKIKNDRQTRSGNNR